MSWNNTHAFVSKKKSNLTFLYFHFKRRSNAVQSCHNRALIWNDVNMNFRYFKAPLDFQTSLKFTFLTNSHSGEWLSEPCDLQVRRAKDKVQEELDQDKLASEQPE